MLNSETFFCYSFRLAYFIKSQGINYAYKGKNKNNNLTYYAFEKSEQLNKAIDRWNKVKSMEADDD